MDKQDKLDKYRGRWLWCEDISTIFATFITILALWSVLFSIERETNMIYQSQSIIASIVDLGSNWLPIPLAILAFWLMILYLATI